MQTTDRDDDRRLTLSLLRTQARPDPDPPVILAFVTRCRLCNAVIPVRTGGRCVGCRMRPPRRAA